MKTTNFLSIDLNQVSETIKAVIGGHQTLAELNQVEDSQLDQCYESAIALYNESRMVEALPKFAYLAMHNPWCRDFLFGLASTLHALQQTEHALVFYGYVTLMDACDAGATFRIGQCYLSLGKKNEAMDALYTSIEQSFLTPEQPEIRSFAQSLLDDITDHRI
ncbi:type III secretion protein [Vibrio ostreicida]|uniref:Type III secretion protein n=1 Tax=Vibrio ostreicida TaxID=526588 RepID=A0ABT8BU79_9VIBR|nr:type III secretion protein [Vibrio ostreicida]MDN3610009.1 type III secretion protein [Vibrio ostreicida]MDN3611037.1 type III secretion protein [Vibrio ostreicida]NPD10434.1 type III secretion protein [Vibrio ostreicida]